MPRMSKQDIALEAVCNIGRAVTAEMDMPGLLELVFKESSRVIDADCFALGLYEPAVEGLHFELVCVGDERLSPVVLRRVEGWGLAGRVVEEGAPLLFADLVKSGLAEQVLPLGEAPRSWLGVPLLSGEWAVGVLVVQSARAKAFGPSDQRILEAIASQAAVAIEDISLHQRHERRIAELSVLSEIARALSSALELDALLETVHQQVSRIFDTTSFYIATYEEGSDEWVLSFCVERGEREPVARYPGGPGLTWNIIQNREPIVLNNLQEYTAFHEAQGLDFIGDKALSWMGVPLIAAGKVVGVMTVQSYEQEYLYDADDLALFSTVATHTAVAIDNARLYEQARLRAEEMETLFTVSRILSASLEPEEVWKAVFDIARRIAPLHAIEACLYDEQKRVLEGVLASTPEGLSSVDDEIYQLGEGFTGRIAQTRRPLLIADVLGETLVRPKREQVAGVEMRSYVGVPMILGERLIGTLEMMHTEPNIYDAHHVDLLMSVAAQAASAVERARLFAQTRRRAERLTIVNRIAQAVGATLQLDDLLDTVYQQIAAVLQHDVFFIALYLEETKELSFLLSVEEGVRGPRQRLPLGGLSSVVVTEKRPLHIRNFEEERHRLPVPLPIGEGTIKYYPSWLGVPMLVADRTLGVICVMADRPYAYTEEERLLLSTIADQVAVALENVRLLEQAHVRAEELAVLNELGRALTARLNVDEVLDESYRQAARLVDTTNFYIALYSADRDEVTFALDATEGEIHRSYSTRRAGQGLTEYVIRSRQPLLIHESLPERMEEIGVEAIGRVALSWLGVPMMVGDRVLGVIAVQSYSTPGLYDKHDRDLLTSIASQAAIAIDNARLFEETQRALQEVREASEQQQRLLDMVRALSTPLVPIAEGILALPLVGTIDSDRAQQIMDVLLEGVSNRRAEAVILDITGVPVVDTSVANYLLQATQAVRLLGAECILVGITPEVAQTVVGLGLDLRDLVTRSDLQGGVEYALQLLERRLER